MSFRTIRPKRSQCAYSRHRWETVNLKGRPILICKKCGAFIDKRIKDKTITKREIRQAKGKPRKPRTKEEIFEETWEKYQLGV